MPARRLSLATALCFVVTASHPAVTDERHCLSKEQQRAAIASGRVVRLAVAVRAVKGRLGGEVVRARLCERGRGLVYLLTVLGRDGKVTRTTVDAASGAVVGGG